MTKAKLFTCLILMCGLMLANMVSANVIISQYYEGSSLNKWLEITNVGTEAVDLSNPQVYLCVFNNNAADDPSINPPNSSYTFNSGDGTDVIDPGESFLFRDNGAVVPEYAIGIATSVSSFNGDDLVILSTTNDETAWANRIDVVGNGTSWGSNTSFYRNFAIMDPNPNFDFAEWTEVSNSTVDNAADGTTERLGVHLYNAGEPIDWYPDTDEDGYGDMNAMAITQIDQPEGYVFDNTDCDDTNADTYPGAEQLCDGLNTDCDDTAWPDTPADEIDYDGDGLLQCEDPCLEDVENQCFYVDLANHIVISEVLWDWPGSDVVEFIELYNPTCDPVDLAGWSLSLINGSNDTEYNNVDLSGFTIPGFGFMLIGHDTDSEGTWTSVTPDITLPVNGVQNGAPDGIQLFDAGGQVVDELSYGVFDEDDWMDGFTENPGFGFLSDDGHSAERKAYFLSTGADMATGGIHADKGNAYDTDINEDNFVEQEFPNPQNLSSDPEIPADVDNDGTPDACDSCIGGDTYDMTFISRRFMGFTPPFELANPTVSSVFPGLNPVIYTRNCNGTVRYLGPDDMLNAGTGYMVRTNLYYNTTITLEGCTITDPVEIERCGTWRAIFTGNPHPVSIPQSHFVLDPSTAYAYMLVFYNGYYSPYIDPVPPGAAVLIYTFANGVTIMPPATPTALDQPAPTPDIASPDWTIALSAQMGDLLDADQVLGVGADFQAGFDDGYDIPDVMPGTAEYINLGFVDHAADREYGVFMQDLRSPVADSQTWPVEVEVNATAGPVELTWPDLSDLPADLTVELHHLATNTVVDMRAVNSYQFMHQGKAQPVNAASAQDGIAFIEDNAAQPGQRYGFEVVVRTSQADASGDTPEHTRSWDYRLAQNQPNPFAVTTTIEYQMPRTQRVELTIFNVAGQRIRTLESGTVEAGSHSVMWDGRSDAGEAVGNGVYFYQLKTSDYTAIQRLILLR